VVEGLGNGAAGTVPESDAIGAGEVARIVRLGAIGGIGTLGDGANGANAATGTWFGSCACAGPAAAAIPGAMDPDQVKTADDGFGASEGGEDADFLILGPSGVRTACDATRDAMRFSNAGGTLLSGMLSSTEAR
jgi:hypothetical protein